MPRKGSLTISKKDLRAVRKQVLTNIREHCGQLYRQGSMTREACRTAAAIAAAEVSDVFEKMFGVRF